MNQKHYDSQWSFLCRKDELDFFETVVETIVDSGFEKAAKVLLFRLQFRTVSIADFRTIKGGFNGLLRGQHILADEGKDFFQDFSLGFAGADWQQFVLDEFFGRG